MTTAKIYLPQHRVTVAEYKELTMKLDPKEETKEPEYPGAEDALDVEEGEEYPIRIRRGGISPSPQVRKAEKALDEERKKRRKLRTRLPGVMRRPKNKESTKTEEKTIELLEKIDQCTPDSSEKTTSPKEETLSSFPSDPESTEQKE